MRFLLDENADLPLGDYLAKQGHDVTSIVRDYTRSIQDEDVLSIANHERRILITNDKDFGALIYQQSLPHSGVILFRMREEDVPFKISRLSDVLRAHAETLENSPAYIVVTDRRIRVRSHP
jgi:predicted nuclease of predicted toxin-antitoxin system